MNTSYQKSTKINIFHAHTFYIYVYMYIFYMQTLLIQSTATTRLVLDAENWLVQFKFGNSLWGSLELWRMHWRDEAVKIEGKGFYGQPWSGSSVTAIAGSNNPCGEGGGLDEWSCCFVFCARTGAIPHPYGAVSSGGGIGVGPWGLRLRMTEEGARRGGGKAKPVQKDGSFALRCGCNVCMQCWRGSASSSPPWSKRVTFFFKISNKAFVPSCKENV